MEDQTVRLNRVTVRVARIDAVNVTLAWEHRSVTVPIHAIPQAMQPLLLMTHMSFYAHMAGDELLLHNFAPAPTVHSLRNTASSARGTR